MTPPVKTTLTKEQRVTIKETREKYKLLKQIADLGDPHDFAIKKQKKQIDNTLKSLDILEKI